MKEQPKEAILKALSSIIDPDLDRDIVSLGFVKEVRSCGDSVSVTIELTTPACPVKDKMKEAARRAIMELPGVNQVDVNMTSQVRSSCSGCSEEKESLIPQVQNVIPVASGKGGVGKSTVAVNLAVSLAGLGAKVGLADLDVYGPSVPKILGACDPPRQEGERLIPAEAHGVKVVSMSYFIPDGEVPMWRGPMLHRTVQEFLGAVEWGELDYLVVDLPPGTGDIQLSLCQLVPLTGAVVVSTPQDVALTIAEKAMIMFSKLRTPLLGIVENMSGFVCSHCGNREEIFGSGGVRRYCTERDLPFLGEIPLSTDLRTASDEGAPAVVSQPESPAAQALTMIAKNVAARASVRALGADPAGRPAPETIELRGTDIRIAWKDGREKVIAARKLRYLCPCAHCVDENTGVRIIKEEDVAEDLTVLGQEPVGRYAVRFKWSDGHDTGMYTFDTLARLLEEPSETPAS